MNRVEVSCSESRKTDTTSLGFGIHDLLGLNKDTSVSPNKDNNVSCWMLAAAAAANYIPHHGYPHNTDDRLQSQSSHNNFNSEL